MGEKILLGTPLKCPDHTATRTEAKDVEEAFDDFNLILPREVSNIWTMEKEGKVRFSPVKYRNEEWWKSVMRK